jgi:hypothetical protein
VGTPPEDPRFDGDEAMNFFSFSVRLLVPVLSLLLLFFFWRLRPW